MKDLATIAVIGIGLWYLFGRKQNTTQDFVVDDKGNILPVKPTTASPLEIKRNFQFQQLTNTNPSPGAAPINLN